ncbi:MAG: SRPBCC family protein [Phycisphaerae bacterium]
MASVTCERTVLADLQRVFDVFTDIEHAAQHVAGIISVEFVGPTRHGPGTEWRETRQFGRMKATEQMKITEYAAPNHYVVEAFSHGTHYRSDFHFEQPSPGETRVRMTFAGRPKSLPAKLMSPLGFMMKGMVKKCLEQDMADLAAVAEGPAEPTPTTTQASA